jgi:DNA-binding NarL/FixJ family response regulator
VTVANLPGVAEEIVKKVRVIICDGHTGFREALEKLLDEAGDIVVTGVAKTAEEMFGEVMAKGADVVLMDIALPGARGLKAVKELTRLRPGLGVVVSSMFGEPQYDEVCRQAGASAYLPKECAQDQLVPLIRRVSCGADSAGGGQMIQGGTGRSL